MCRFERLGKTLLMRSDGSFAVPTVQPPNVVLRGIILGAEVAVPEIVRQRQCTHSSVGGGIQRENSAESEEGGAEGKQSQAVHGGLSLRTGQV